MAKLTTAQRKKLPKSQFAIPGRAPESGSYPIDTENRARDALARVAQFGTPEEQATVRAAVHKKYPGIVEGGKASASVKKSAKQSKPKGSVFDRARASVMKHGLGV